MAEPPRRVVVCHGLYCTMRGSRQLYDVLDAWLDERDDVLVEPYNCFNGCSYGPNVIVLPDRVWYEGTQLGDLDQIVAHVTTGEGGECRGGRVPGVVKLAAFDKLDDEQSAGT